MNLVLQPTQPTKSNAVVYVVPGIRATVRVSKKLIVGAVTERFEDLTLASAPAPKIKLSKEERKALRATQPRKTEAEKIAEQEKKLAARKAKLAAVPA